jgi:hypothetical protein
LPENLFTLPEQHASRLRDEPHCQSFAPVSFDPALAAVGRIFPRPHTVRSDALIREVAGEALRSTRFDLLDKTGLSPAATHALRAQLLFLRLTFFRPF